jgi:hypothetical protein
MTFRQPPAIAFWCLVNLSDPDEGLLGDLFEEYQHRHSRWWFWRQVAIAIVVGFARNVWTHKLENVAGGLHTVQAALGLGAQSIIAPVMLAAGSIFGRGWSNAASLLDRRLYVAVIGSLVPIRLDDRDDGGPAPSGTTRDHDLGDRHLPSVPVHVGVVSHGIERDRPRASIPAVSRQQRAVLHQHQRRSVHRKPVDADVTARIERA